MRLGRKHDVLDELSDEELDALVARPRPPNRWARGFVLGIVLVSWLVLSSGVINSFVLAPLGCILLVVLAVCHARGRRVGAWLAVIAVGTAWSFFVLGAVLVWAPSNPTVPTVAPGPGSLTIEQRMGVDGAALEFFEVAYQERDLERYRQHVVGRPEPSQLTGCWIGGAVSASPSDRSVTKRIESQPNWIIDVSLAFLVADLAYRARLEVTAHDWQVVGLDRVPGYESCPMGFPLPPAPAPSPPAAG
jgi:hypothetical protein